MEPSQVKMLGVCDVCNHVKTKKMSETTVFTGIRDNSGYLKLYSVQIYNKCRLEELHQKSHLNSNQTFILVIKQTLSSVNYSN